MDVSPLYVPGPCNPLYFQPHRLTNPAAWGDRVHYEIKGFTDWINSYLWEGGPSTRIADLQEDLSDGVTLLHFVRQISFERPPCIHAMPTIYVHRLENTEACLLFLDGLGVDMKGVYAEDVASGNIKTILALCRAMFVRFEENETPLGVYMPYTGQKGNEADPSTETSQPNSFFTVWYKEDMAVIGWIRRLLGQDLRNYSEFADGILLCAIVNQLWAGSITQEEVLFSTPLERLEIAADVAEQFLGVPRQELDLKAVAAGLGREALPLYLLQLKAASEQLFEEYMMLARERNWTKNEEEAVNQMRRRLIRQHSKAVSPVPSAVRPNSEPPSSRVATFCPPKGGRDCNKTNSSDPHGSARSPLLKLPDQGASPSTRADGPEAASRRPGPAQQVVLTDGSRQPPSKSPSDAEQGRPIPDAGTSPKPAEDATTGSAEQMETSLSSLMQAESAPLLPSAGTRHNEDRALPVPRSSPPTSTSSPHRGQTPSSRRPLHQQPDVAGFFSPFSMPFVPIVKGRREPPSSKYGIPARNSSPSVVEGDSLTRGKLTSWSHKNVKENQSSDVQSGEPVSPQRPSRSHSATLLARLAARSPGAVAGASSSDKDE